MSREMITEWRARIAAILVVLVVFVICSALFTSCTRTVYVPQTSIQRDSIYLTQYKRDSIYLHDSVFVHMKSDTLIVEKWRTRYFERVATDTLYIERADTLRVPYPVEKPLTYWQKSYISIGKVSLGVWAGLLIAILVYIIIRRKL